MLNKETIYNIIEAIGIEKQELVLLHFWGEDNDRPVLHMFELAIASQGASPISIQQSREFNAELFDCMKTGSLGMGTNYFKLFEPIDIVIDICMYQPVVPGEQMKPEGMALYREYMGRLFQALTAKKKFVQIRIPTIANAESSALTAQDYIYRMEKAYDVDYKCLRTACIDKIEELRGSKLITLTTGADCRLTFHLGDREWNIDAGDGDFPCGEVYIAPKEELSQGSIYFEKLFVEDMGEFNHITLTVEDGKIVTSNHPPFNEFLQELPENGTVIGEFGIGLNPNITEISGDALLDEKMYGTVHIGIGMNTLFGGQNNSPIHMDFVVTGKYSIITDQD
ncbi:MAG: Leucyl aminopeptidase (aminopeptidase T)-like protein [Herbinix sp.]|nr:Leucyl aminopeptidase (aminopeptidase T)-like protein [Herbinix sp.]